MPTLEPDPYAGPVADVAEIPAVDLGHDHRTDGVERALDDLQVVEHAEAFVVGERRHVGCCERSCC